MKLIFSVDVIFPPLTGIGRYAWELARRLRSCSTITEQRYYSNGQWVDDYGRLDESILVRDKYLPSFMRRWLAGQSWAIRAYSMVMPVINEIRLRPYADHLFHSPNYFLPRFSGPAVATVHDLSIYRYPEMHPTSRRLLFDLEFDKSLGRATHLITDSEYVRREVMDYFGWPGERITAIPLGVDAAFQPRAPEDLAPHLAPFGLSPGGYTLCVSTLEPRKKLDRLIQAYGALPEPLRRFYPLVIVGGRGWLSDDIYVQIERAQAAGWLKYLGFVSEVTLPILYAGAHAFVYPSIYEGFGLPVIEALASGVPVLTSDKSSLPEVAGEAGLLIDPDDVDSFRHALEKLLTDNTWRTNAVVRGLEQADGMNWQACVERTVEVYRQIWQAY